MEIRDGSLPGWVFKIDEVSAGSALPATVAGPCARSSPVYAIPSAYDGLLA
jgi:hypothetical protein